MLSFLNVQLKKNWVMKLSLKKDSLFILLPAFTMGQLEAAFKIGFFALFTFYCDRFDHFQYLIGLGYDDGIASNNFDSF